MILRIAALGAVLVAGLAIADDDADRARLMGSWILVDGGKDAPVWTFQDKGNIIHVTNSKSGRVLVEFDCDAFGHECTIKDGGRPATVSLWFVGPKLVEWETEGNKGSSDVTKGTSVWKRTFGITGEGDTMDLVLAQVAPSNKQETQHFRRMTAADAAH